MDPNDFEYVFDVPRSAAATDPKAFADAFEHDLSGSMDGLPLQSFCQKNGCPADVEFVEVVTTKFEKEKICGRLYVSFVEKTYTGCDDLTFEESRQCSLDFELDRAGASVEFFPVETKRQSDRHDPDI